MVLIVKNPPANVGDTRDTGSTPGSGRSPAEGNDHQYSFLENSMNQACYSLWGHKKSEMTEYTL